MNGVLFLIPVSIALGLIGLLAFFWNLRHDQFEDPDGDAQRILIAPDEPAIAGHGRGERPDSSTQHHADGAGRKAHG